MGGRGVYNPSVNRDSHPFGSVNRAGVADYLIARAFRLAQGLGEGGVVRLGQFGLELLLRKLPD